jgi:PEP-CTERM motif
MMFKRGVSLEASDEFITLRKHMKNIVKALALSTTLACASALAAPIIIDIDTFNTNPQSISDLIVDGLPVVESNSVRTLSNNLLVGVPPIGNTLDITGGPTGFLDITNGGGENSEVRVSWALAAGRIPASALSAALFFKVLQSDGNPTNMSFYLNGNLFSSIDIAGKTKDQTFQFGMSASQRSVASAGGTLELRINGETGWDFSVDSLGLSYEPAVSTVPVPASVALLAIGLVGFAARKKK